MELRDLECIVVLSEELHFGRAAQRLGLAQPPLTRRIQKVERELGLSLFERGTRGITVTPAGADLVEQSRKVLSAAERTHALAGALRSGRRGVVRIGAVGSAFFEALPTLLAPARLTLPDVELQIDEVESADLVESLRREDVDLGLLRPPVPQGLVARAVWAEPLVAAVGRGHRLIERDMVDVADLAAERFVFFRRHEGPGYWDRVAGLFAGLGIAFEPVVLASHVTTILGLVALGQGVSIVPASARHLAPPGVRYVPLAASTTLPLAVASRAEGLNRATLAVLATLPSEPVAGQGSSTARN